ncbi:hypothetical protein MMPV_005917 [Pyropia vietnamensis]
MQPPPPVGAFTPPPTPMYGPLLAHLAAAHGVDVSRLAPAATTPTAAGGCLRAARPPPTATVGPGSSGRWRRGEVLLRLPPAAVLTPDAAAAVGPLAAPLRVALSRSGGGQAVGAWGGGSAGDPPPPSAAEVVALATLVGWGLLTLGADAGAAGRSTGGDGDGITGSSGAITAAATAAAALACPYVASVDWAGLAAGHPACWSPAVTAAVAASHGPGGLYKPITRARGGVDAAAAVVADALLGAMGGARGGRGGKKTPPTPADATTAARLAVVAVLSRGFVLGPGGVNVLLPLVDMANHAPPADANAEVLPADDDGGGDAAIHNGGPGGAVLIAGGPPRAARPAVMGFPPAIAPASSHPAPPPMGAPPAAGAEVLICYGMEKTSNTTLVPRYGFGLPTGAAVTVGLPRHWAAARAAPGGGGGGVAVSRAAVTAAAGRVPPGLGASFRAAARLEGADGGGALVAAVAAELSLRTAAVGALDALDGEGGVSAARQLLGWEVEVLRDLAAAVGAG